MKTESNSQEFVTKKISTKNSTNPESFKGFRHGRWINLLRSHGYSHTVRVAPD